MDEFIYINKFSDLKKGDYIKFHIIPDIMNIDNKITKEGTIYLLGDSVKNTVIKDDTGKEISFNYVNKNVSILIERKQRKLVDYIPDGILFYS